MRLSRIALDARRSADSPLARRRLTHIAKRDQQAVESALVLADPEERRVHGELAKTIEQLQKEIGDKLEQVLTWLPEGESGSREFGPGEVVPRRLVERDAPGLAGTSYFELVQMAEEMHTRDSKMKYDSLRIIGDEM